MWSTQSMTPDAALATLCTGLEQYAMRPLPGGAGKSGAPIRLLLHRLTVKDGEPVLLLHGASAASNSFLVPCGDSERNSCNLACFLAREGFDVWLLDWRASNLVSEAFLANGGAETAPQAWTFNQAAEFDIKAAIEVMDQVKAEDGSRWAETDADDEPKADRYGTRRKLHVVAHCMGAAILAEALLKQFAGVHGRLSRVVLSTIGLFYQTSLDGRLKADAQLLQQMLAKGGSFPVIDPRTGASQDRWPKIVADLYDNLRLPYDDARIEQEDIPDEDRDAVRMFNRLSLMYGQPYREGNLAPAIHHRIVKLEVEPRDGAAPPLPAGTRVVAAVDGNRVPRAEVLVDYHGKPDEQLVLWRCHQSFTPRQMLQADGQDVGLVRAAGKPAPALLEKLFGAIPLHLFMHVADNVLAGVATDAGRARGTAPRSLLEGEFVQGEQAYGGFNELTHLTLIGGGLNRLWHRDSIDRMADWLSRNPKRRRDHVTKWIMRDYGHQDLLWGRNAETDVFPKIRDALRPPVRNHHPPTSTDYQAGSLVDMPTAAF